jgi:hypothetical protein
MGAGRRDEGPTRLGFLEKNSGLQKDGNTQNDNTGLFGK